MGQGGVAISAEQDAAFESLAQMLNARVARHHVKPPFPGAPETHEWRVAWTSDGASARLVASAVGMDGVRTDSTWLSFEDGRLDGAAWLRIVSRPLEELYLGARVAHRKGAFGDGDLDAVLVQGLPPGQDEWSQLHGPIPPERDLEATRRATDGLVGRLRAIFGEVLPRLQSLGDFVIELEDGTLSVRYATIFGKAEAYRSVIDCARRLLESARG
jgi:hypothetical protein